MGVPGFRAANAPATANVQLLTMLFRADRQGVGSCEPAGRQVQQPLGGTCPACPPHPPWGTPFLLPVLLRACRQVLELLWMGLLARPPGARRHLAMPRASPVLVNSRSLWPTWRWLVGIWARAGGALASPGVSTQVGRGGDLCPGCPTRGHRSAGLAPCPAEAGVDLCGLRGVALPS